MPRLEEFEARIVPSTLKVLNNEDSGLGSLRAILASASSGDTIVFASSVHKITLTSGELTIDKNLSIDGSGADLLTISGDNSSTVFDISAGTTLTLNGLTIANGQAVQGGGIDNFGNLAINQCTLLNNQAIGGSGNSTTPDAANGGGIANEIGASLVLTNSLLKNNVAAASAGNDSFGGALLNLGSATVKSCSFSGNEVTGGGSSSYYDGSYGGAIESFGFAPDQLYGSTLTLSDSTFSGNQAIGASGVTFGDAAAIDVEYSTVATINNCSFTDNLGIGGADGGYAQAGAIFAEGCTLNLSNSTFTDNQAIAGRAGGTSNGGAILFFAATTLNLTNDGFFGNVSIGGNGVPADQVAAGQAGGGAIEDIGGTVSLNGCTLSSNKAIGGNDGANPTGGSPTGSNEYGAGGGILLLDGAVMTVANSTITGNLAEGGSSTEGTGGAASGGGIEDSNGIGGNASSTLTLSNSTLVGNVAIGGNGASGVPGGYAFGGGIDIGFSSTATITHTTLKGNKAQGGAGGNGASGGGGYGGGIAVAIQSYFGFPDTSSFSLSNSALFGNSALGGGGGIGGDGGNGTGGGVYVGPGGTATISQTAFTANLAIGGNGVMGGNGLGGGCYVDSGATVGVTNSAIILNMAFGGDGQHLAGNGEGIGGGVYTLGTFTFDLLTYIVFNESSTSGNNIGP